MLMLIYFCESKLYFGYQSRAYSHKNCADICVIITNQTALAQMSRFSYALEADPSV